MTNYCTSHALQRHSPAQAGFDAEFASRQGDPP